jgi:hypothetical protein
MSRSRSIQIRPNRGSGFPVKFTVPDSTGQPADLFGWTPGLIDVSPELVGLLTVGFIDPAIGRVQVMINWDDRLQAGKVYTFRVQLTNPTEQPQASPPVEVKYT